MNVTLKSLKIATNMSEETIAFTATVYRDGVKIGDAKNDGQGGETFVYMDAGFRSITDVEFRELVDAVDELVYAEMDKKEHAKMLKKVDTACLKYICVGRITDVHAEYWRQGFKPARPLAEIATMGNGKGLEAIQKMYDRIKSELKGDEQILNKNLGALGVNL